jgi:hypothetical protein
VLLEEVSKGTLYFGMASRLSAHEDVENMRFVLLLHCSDCRYCIGRELFKLDQEVERKVKQGLKETREHLADHGPAV